MQNFALDNEVCYIQSGTDNAQVLCLQGCCLPVFQDADWCGASNALYTVTDLNKLCYMSS